MLFILEPDGMHALYRRESLALVKLLGRFPGKHRITEPVKVLHT
jgi:hypothetical protein